MKDTSACKHWKKITLYTLGLYVCMYVSVCVLWHSEPCWGKGIALAAEQKHILGAGRDWVSCLAATPCHGVWIGVLESRDHVFDHPVLREEWMDRCMDERVVLAMTQIAVSTLQLTELQHCPCGGPCSVCLNSHRPGSNPPGLPGVLSGR